MHELMHNLGAEDPALENALHCSGSSICISQTLAEDCFGVTK